jgi:hypothetical protein
MFAQPECSADVYGQLEVRSFITDAYHGTSSTKKPLDKRGRIRSASSWSLLGIVLDDGKDVVLL